MAKVALPALSIHLQTQGVPIEGDGLVHVIGLVVDEVGTTDIHVLPPAKCEW
jgi:hypothetical protein